MPMLDLSPDELLTTTRSVRKRLDLTRPVEPEVIRACMEIAMQAPTPGSEQRWHFLIVTDPTQRKALADIYRHGAATGPQADHLDQEAKLQALIEVAADEKEAGHLRKMADSALYLTAHLHEVPILVIPCIEGRAEHLSAIEQAALWGAVLPATWSFMLAARSRGLGTVLTILHLLYEREAADVLGVPYEQIQQVGLIPVAYTVGTTFRPAARKPLEHVLHWNHW